LVTGGGRGIGRGIALLAASEGARVVVADYGGRFDAVAEPSQGPADEVVADIAAAGGEAVACYEDVATMAGAERLVAAALERFGGLDAMVCCAGIAVQKPLWELDEDEWDAVIRVHLKGHFVCTKAALPHLMAQGSGRIVTFSSSAALTAPLEGTSYAAAKAGVLGFTWSAARALQRHGITVNCIMPGGHTRLVDNLSGD
jgi:NAD(P)-dependent dehydrogenase (short-subunit alcohol dehydrogenase family)